MAKPIFMHNYTPISERPVVKEKQNAKATKTERSGFVSMEKRIKAIMLSGRQLDMARREEFHFNDDAEIDPNFTDHSIDPSLDISEIHANVQSDSEAILSKAEARKQAKAAKKAAAEASETAETAPTAPPQDTPKEG